MAPAPEPPDSAVPPVFRRKCVRDWPLYRRRLRIKSPQHHISHTARMIALAIIVAGLLAIVICVRRPPATQVGQPGGGLGGQLGDSNPAGPCPSGQVCAGGVCGPCSTAAPCPPGLICNAGACSLCGSGVACPDGLQCVNGLCTACSASVPCSDGQVCVNGRCGSCSESAPCPAGQVCISGKCVPACTPCDNALMPCPAGQVCVSGSCVATPACSPTGACPVGLVCGSDGKCGGCYGWKTWQVGKSFPADAYGVGSAPGFPGIQAMPAVVVADGTTKMGFISLDTGNFTSIRMDGSSESTNPSTVDYLATNPACPAAQPTSDPAAAIHYRTGAPVCMDLQKKGALIPWATTCAQFMDYSPTLVGPK